MPLNIIAVRPFPLLPQLPGIPPLPLPVGGIGLPSLPILASASIPSGPFPTAPWGIFGPGLTAIISAQSVVDFAIKNDKRVVTAPQEAGAFVSYNKIADPFSGKIKFAQGGTASDKDDFFASIQAAVDSLNLYTVVTPDVIYPSVNITHFDYKRDAHSGFQLVQVEVWFEEIRVTATAAFSQTATPAGQSPQTAGPTQAQTPSDGQTNHVAPATAISNGPPPPGGGQAAAIQPDAGAAPAVASAGNVANAPATASANSGVPPGGAYTNPAFNGGSTASASASSASAGGGGSSSATYDTGSTMSGTASSSSSGGGGAASAAASPVQPAPVMPPGPASGGGYSSQTATGSNSL